MIKFKAYTPPVKRIGVDDFDKVVYDDWIFYTINISFDKRPRVVAYNKTNDKYFISRSNQLKNLKSIFSIIEHLEDNKIELVAELEKLLF
jgi:hypothetical protein